MKYAVSLAAIAALGLTACGPDAAPPTPDDVPVPTESTGADTAAPGGAAADDRSGDQQAAIDPDTLPPVTPPQPGEPGALPDDRTPLDESPFTPESAQGAAQVLQTYYALVEEGRYDKAYRLWSNGGKASRSSPGDFPDRFAQYYQFHALTGAPGEIEGAAGSLYVEIPVQLYGRLSADQDYREFNQLGAATLRRVNNVPGATAEQLKWRIASIKLEDAP